MAKDPTIKSELNELSATVANLSGDMPFSLPSSYFESFPQKIIERVESEGFMSKEPELSDTLQALKNNNPFEVPSKYFEEFRVNMPAKQSPVISLNFRKWASLAAAASVAGLIFGIIFLTNNSESVATLASNSISHEAMETYLSEVDAFELGDKDSESLSVESNTLVDVSPSSISEMLKDIPDKDISRFMDLNGFEEIATIN